MGHSNRARSGEPHFRSLNAAKHAFAVPVAGESHTCARATIRSISPNEYVTCDVAFHNVMCCSACSAQIGGQPIGYRPQAYTVFCDYVV